MATKLADMPTILLANYLAGINTFMIGKPGIGKTMTIDAFTEKAQAKAPGFKAHMFYAPTMSPMDIQASAPNYETHKLEMFNNAALPNAYDDADQKGVVFFGELQNTDPATAKLLQKYVNGEDMSGVLRKPEGVVVVADGNRLEDKSGVQQQGRAFLSRFEQIEVFNDANDNIKYATENNWHSSVLTFFRENPALIDNYDEVFETSAGAHSRSEAGQRNGNNATSEEGKRGIWANMRSWDRMSRKETVAERMGREITQGEVIGNLGTAVAMQYIAHKQILSSLSSFEYIMKDPMNVPVPTKMDEQYMLAVMIAMKVTADGVETVKQFGERMPREFQAVILRTMATRKGFNTVGSAGYLKWITDPELMKLVTGGH